MQRSPSVFVRDTDLRFMLDEDLATDRSANEGKK